MTPANRINLCQALTRFEPFSGSQMNAIESALGNLGWQQPQSIGNKMNKNSDLMSDWDGKLAPGAAAPARCEPPVVDPHAALRGAVVEAAMDGAANGWLPRHIEKVMRLTRELHAATLPPDPADRLAKAWQAVRCAQPHDAGAEMDAAVKAAIAALRKGAVA